MFALGLNECVRLSSFFDIIIHTINRSNTNKLEQQQPLHHQRAHEEILIAILTFLQSILSASEEVRRLIADTRERPLELLKSLLMTNVKPRIKASVLDTLRAFSSSPALAPSVWMLLEVSGILSPSGLVIELTDESNHQTYTETVAFLRLLEHLLRVSDPRVVGSIAQQCRPDTPVLGPYLSFVVDEVFIIP
jgi:hypothetical protein